MPLTESDLKRLESLQWSAGRCEDLSADDVDALIAEVKRLGAELAAMEEEHPCCSGAVLVAQEKARREAGQ